MSSSPINPFDAGLNRAIQDWDQQAEASKKLVGCRLDELKRRGLGSTLYFAYDAKTRQWSIKEITSCVSNDNCLNRALLCLIRFFRYIGIAHKDTRLFGEEKETVLRMRMRLHNTSFYEPRVQQPRIASEQATVRRREAEETEQKAQQERVSRRESRTAERNLEQTAQQKQQEITELEQKEREYTTLIGTTEDTIKRLSQKENQSRGAHNLLEAHKRNAANYNRLLEEVRARKAAL